MNKEKTNILIIGLKINESGEKLKIEKTFSIDLSKLIGEKSKKFYIRKGYMNGTLFLSERGHGSNGAGDICKIYGGEELEYNVRLARYESLHKMALKANAII